MNQDVVLLKRQARPAHASSSWDPEVKNDQSDLAWFQVFVKLPKVLKYGMSSFEVEAAIIKLAKDLGILEITKVGEISRIVRDIFVDKITRSDIEKRAIEKLEISGEGLKSFMIELKKIVSLVKFIGKKDLSPEIDMMALIPAMKQYPDLKNQELGDQVIELDTPKRFVPPYIKNWIEDYIQQVGAHSHNSLERSNYLYNTNNPKKLKEEDRKVLLAILESYDTDKELCILKEGQTILIEDYLDITKAELKKLQQQVSEVGDLAGKNRSINVDASKNKNLKKRNKTQSTKEDQKKPGGGFKNILDLKDF